MIRKLRWKFSAIMMTIVGLLLATIFTTLYYTTKANYVQRSMDTLHSAMMENYPVSMREQAGHVEGQSISSNGQPETNRHAVPNGQDSPNRQSAPNGQDAPNGQKAPSGQRSPSRRRRQESPFMVVDIRQGNYTVVKNQLLNTESQEAQTLVSLAESTGGETGILKNQHLRYLRGKTMPDQTVRYVFADIYEEQNSLYWQVIHSSIIGACSFAVFFLFSILLSRWAVKPVEDAWQQQRQFVADASHELKTPLTVILSNADMLEKDHDIPEGQNRQRISHIKAESLRMKQLTESLLTLARSDSGQETAVCASVDLSFIVNSSLMTFEPLIFDMGKHITCDIEASLRVNGDEKKLRQLSDILLDNACKYSRDKGSIRVTLKKTGTKEALLTVSNEGTPLTKEEIRHLFLRFYRADTARSNIPGYGLGLSIAQSIVSEHGGRIDVSTDGSRVNSFMVRLPLQE